MADRLQWSVGRVRRSTSTSEEPLPPRASPTGARVSHRLGLAGVAAGVVVALLLIAPVSGFTMVGSAAVGVSGPAPLQMTVTAPHSTAGGGGPSLAPPPPHRMFHAHRGPLALGAHGVAPSVLDTLVLLNNTVVPGNFPAALGLGPAAVAFDPGTQEIFSADFGSNTVTVVDDLTNAPV